MASTVYANGRAVATSTSGHVAHVLPPFDTRLVSMQYPTPLWNEVPSSKIYAQAPDKTKFQSGKIWTSPTKVGPTSSPLDTWPGVKNGGAVNSYAMAAPGAGSPNVIVQANRVLRFLDLTEQNARNSMGMINDAAGAAIAKAEYDEWAKKNLKQADKDDASKSKGSTDGEGGKTDEGSEKKKEAPPPEEKKGECLLQEATLSEGARKQSPEQNNTAYLQTVTEKSVVFDSKVDRACGEHPIWEIQGSKYQQAQVTRTASNPTSLAAEKLTGWFGIADVIRVAMRDPVVVTGVVKGHQGQKTRILHVFPKDKAKFKFNLTKGKTPFAQILAACLHFASLGGKLPNIDKNSTDIKITSDDRDLEIGVGWEPEKSGWRCPCVFEVSISRTFLKIEGRKYFALTFLRFIPALGWIIAGVETINYTIVWVNDKFGRSIPTVPLPEGYVRAKIDFKIAATLYIKSFHSKTPGVGGKPPAKEFGPGASAKIGVEVGVGILFGRPSGIFSVGGELALSSGVSGKMKEGKIDFAIDPLKLKGTVWFEYDLMKMIKPSEQQESQGWLSRLASRASNAAQNLTGLKLKDKKELSHEWKLWDGKTLGTIDLTA